MASSSQLLTGTEARRQLYSLLDEGLTRKQLMDRILTIGTEYLGVDHGHIVDIDVEENRWEVTKSTDPPDGPYPEGLPESLDNTYCRRTIQQDEPLALHDAFEQGWQDDHAYQLHKLETYLGVRIETAGQPFGTLCFVSSEARDEPFSVEELIFVEIAGEVLGQALSRNQHLQEIANRDRVIEMLNRVLRHNLRNELNVVSGYAQLLQSERGEPYSGYADQIVSKTNSLLELAAKARTLDELTRTVPVPRPMDVVPPIEALTEEFADGHPHVSVSVESPEEARVLAAPALTRAVRELLLNVAKHAGDFPSVTVRITAETAETVITIQDDGPGLPADEQRVLTGGYETPLEHGSGLGLFLVYWIVSMLDGTITVDASADGTTLELRLPAVTSDEN